VRRARLVSTVLFVGTLAALLAGARTAGIPRDEAYYFRAGEQYLRFFTDLTHGRGLSAAIAELAYNNEHPALMKLLFGASWRLFHGVFGAPEILSFRLPTLLLVAWMSVLLYRFGARIGEPAAGALAAVLTIAQPHLFFHAQLACFDAPIMVFWVAVVYAYFRALDLGGTRWAVACGVLFGLSQAVKFNTVFLPPILVAHWLYVRARGGRPPLRPLVALATLGPLVFFAVWPWMWQGALTHVRLVGHLPFLQVSGRLADYVAFHAHHWHYNFEFLGRNYYLPPYPKSFPWVELALTVPVVTLALGVGGAVLAAWPRRPYSCAPDLDIRARPGALLLLNLIVPPLVLNFPDAPIFGGVKHFLAALPFLALLGAIALRRLGHAFAELTERVRAPLVVAGLAACAIVPAVWQTAYAHPYELSFYNGLAGGFAGGADLGMNRQFWGYSPRGLLPWMNATLPAGARVYFHDLNGDAFAYYQRAGLLRPDIVYTGIEEPAIQSSRTALVIHERHFDYYDYWVWQIYGSARPARLLEREGVPLVSVYQRGSR
jgi:4-amino-4-deoxy-L-arabinose transferase-like glycosyltransferase